MPSNTTPSPVSAGECDMSRHSRSTRGGARLQSANPQAYGALRLVNAGSAASAFSTVAMSSCDPERRIGRLRRRRRSNRASVHSPAGAPVYAVCDSRRSVKPRSSASARSPCLFTVATPVRSSRVSPRAAPSALRSRFRLCARLSAVSAGRRAIDVSSSGVSPRFDTKLPARSSEVNRVSRSSPTRR
jgi:hypothetical protein